MTNISDDSTHPHWLFVYGTLKRGHGNNYLLEQHESKFVSPAVTAAKFLLNNGFPFVWQQPLSDLKSYESFLGRVRGDLYRVTDEGLKACDWLEGHPTSYCRTPVEVCYPVEGAGEQIVTAGIYLMGWSQRKMNLQLPDKSGCLEWGRDRQKEARDFQRNTGRRFQRGLKR